MVLIGMAATVSACTFHGGHSHSTGDAARWVARVQKIQPAPETGGFLVFQEGTGPGVLILHELPGMTLADMHLADLVAGAGYAVYMPLMFGKPGEDRSIVNGIRACFGGGFHCFSRDNSGPVAARLRTLAKYIQKLRGDRIGVIGLCLTGALPLSLMADPGVAAPVLAEPSLPFALTDGAKAALGISHDDIMKARERQVRILAFRFSDDGISAPQRSRTLRRELGGQIDITEIDSSPGNLHGFTRSAHAVLTSEFADYPGDPTRAALDKILAFFHDQLQQAP
jgi:dienelactone hydrolase